MDRWDCVGFDIERHDYGDGARYPAQLVLQDVLTLHGKQFNDAALIVASPPCQEFSYMAMPWSRAKAIAADYRSGVRDVKKLTALFDACFRIQREAIAAAGHFIPLVVENVRGAQPWVGRSRWNYGSYHLWGDVPALMPMTKAVLKGGWLSQADGASMRRDDQKVPGFRFDGSGKSFQTASVEESGVKVPGMNWSDRSRPAQAFNDTAIRNLREGTKNTGGSWFNVAHNTTSGIANNPVSVPVGSKTVGHVNKRDGYGHTRHMTNQAESDCVKQGGDWFNASQPSISRLHGSKSKARKAVSAAIAKIPFPLARHIASHFKPSAE